MTEADDRPRWVRLRGRGRGPDLGPRPPGRDHPGSRLLPLVVARPGETLTEDEILDRCRDSLARFKWPRHIEVVDSLPKHVTGKVLRRALRGDG